MEQPDIEDIENTIKNPDNSFLNKGNFKNGVLSTGSTVLDCAISSNRIHGGGLPGGIIVEIFGPSQSGKTSILAEIATSCQFKGGDIKIQDPEARLDTAYAARCGLILEKHQLNLPDTIEDIDEQIFKWKPKPTIENAICVHGVDAIGALSTRKEMDDGDKVAALTRGKRVHELLRKLGRIIYKNNWIILLNNHETQDYKTGAITTPCGTGPKYWSSVRMRVKKAYKNGIIQKSWGNIKKTIGIRSEVSIIKSVDDPFREAPIFIIFGQGIDDVRGNLTWLKEKKGDTEFDCINKTFKRIDPAIQYIEENNLELELREKVINFWQEIEDHFKIDRKKKVRF